MLLRFGALLLLLAGVDPDPRAAAFGRQQGLRTQLADGAPYDLARYERKLRQLSATQFLPHDECLALAARWRSAPPPRGAPPPHAGGSDARLGDLLENWNPSRHVLSLPRKPLRPALCRFHWAEPSQRAAALVNSVRIAARYLESRPRLGERQRRPPRVPGVPRDMPCGLWISRLLRFLDDGPPGGSKKRMSQNKNNALGLNCCPARV